MESQYRILPTETLNTGIGYLRPTQQLPAHVTMESPAIDVMTDFTKVAALFVAQGRTMKDAEQRMIAAGVRLLLVTNQINQVIGICTARDVAGEKPMRVAQATGHKFDELTVRDVMTPQHQVEVVLMSDVAMSRVGDMVKTLKRMGRQHALVVDKDASGNQSVRGLFSATQISKQLGIDIDTTDIAGTFAALGAALG